MKKGKVILMAVLLSLLAFSSARAEYIADITYDYSRSGTYWVFDFTVNNLSTGDSTGDLDYFMIDFDADDWSYYTNLSWLTDNDWLASAYPYGPEFGWLPAAVDADAFMAGELVIAQGDSLGGFSVQFDYAGALAPYEQNFSFFAQFGSFIVDPDGIPGTEDEYIDYLGYDDGYTRTDAVPEPMSLLLLGTGLFGLLGIGRKKKETA